MSDRLAGLGKFAVTVIDKDDDIGRYGADGGDQLPNLVNGKGRAQTVPARALDMHQTNGIIGTQRLLHRRVIGQALRGQLHLLIPHAPFAQAANAVPRRADNALQRIIRGTRCRQHGIARAQHAEQRQRQRVGAAQDCPGAGS